MFSAIYVEEAVHGTERVQQILARYPGLPVIPCARYGEVFNRAGQNFRVQKQNPALILAEKHGPCVLPAPAGYGFAAGASFYFSHMLNCLYDCRYCFLQGMYRSAHYVLFVNYEAFSADLQKTIAAQEGRCVFYSGYDCDSLALEPVSRFTQFFLPMFRELPQATLEIRTKSTQVRALLEMEPLSNCVIAMSFSSEQAGNRYEHRVPDLSKRLEAAAKLQAAGWSVALRFEPVISEPAVEQDYYALFERVFTVLDTDKLHSVSIGEFRMPKDYHKKIAELYPNEALFAQPVVVSDGLLSLRGAGDELLHKLESRLLSYVEARQYYRCASEDIA